MNPTRDEIVADLQYAAQFHLSKATAAIIRRGDGMPPKTRKRLFDAIEDTGAILGDYVRALLGVYQHEFESYETRLFCVLDTLDEACRVAGVPSGDYRPFQRALERNRAE